MRTHINRGRRAADSQHNLATGCAKIVRQTSWLVLDAKASWYLADLMRNGKRELPVGGLRELEHRPPELGKGGTSTVIPVPHRLQSSGIAINRRASVRSFGHKILSIYKGRQSVDGHRFRDFLVEEYHLLSL